jgi:oxaloacetate decarboxylase alpha subunit
VAEVQLVDVSLRDGNQSLWGATGLRTEHVLQIAPVMNRVGFRALDFMSSTAMGVAVRTHREDPWERIRLTHAAMPDTPLQLIGTGFRFISWERAHPEVMRLVYECLVRAGISRFVVLDPMHDMDAILANARMIRQAGGTETIVALTYTISAVHDDAFYAGIAGQAAASPDIDRAYIKDPAGLLTPERARTLIPAVRAQLRGKPLEMHAHATIGLSPLVYLTAPELGVEVLQVACGALANGSSLPDAERITANLRDLGHTVNVDDRLLARVARYFDRLAEAESLPAGRPQQYDAAFTRHQLAGGVLTTLRRQLTELGLEAKFGAVMEEVELVRAELGYPIMVTPFPQMVMGQALANVLGAEAGASGAGASGAGASGAGASGAGVSGAGASGAGVSGAGALGAGGPGARGGSRYEVVPDQVIRYVLGSFGKPTAPVEPWVLDRILDRPRARELAAEPPPLSVAELRQRLPRGVSDEELLLRFGMPAEEVDAMLAARPAARHYHPEVQPVLRLLRELGSRPPVERLVVEKPGFRLELRGGGVAQEAVAAQGTGKVQKTEAGQGGGVGG